FCEYLISQRDLSPQTIGSYRDTFRLLLGFLDRQYRIKPDIVCVDDLDAPRVLMFLDYLERSRGNTARTRNNRLAAIRSFLRHAAAANPLLLPVAQRVLAIPAKRFERASVGYLTREQMQTILDAPDVSTFSGQRDRVLLMLLYNTGARVSELAGLQIQDVSLESRMSVHIRGKGRKNRSVPLWRQTVKMLRSWLRQLHGPPDSPLLPNARGNPMTRSGIAQRLRLAAKRAASENSALRDVRISPHMIRHTTAMHLLQSGVDLSVIAMWLGHETIQTTHQYLEADLESMVRGESDPELVRMAREAVARNGASIPVYESRFFSALDDDEFDVVLFNPPYVPGATASSLDLPLERRSQWDGGEDGLAVIRGFLTALAELTHPVHVLFTSNRWFVDVGRVQEQIKEVPELAYHGVWRHKLFPIDIHAVRGPTKQ
ncbi:MAG: tyrosine-type recombinase/integrase, partial [Planctomycetes bacterium]|nr:tyrosine-type recombinase/integrase [Planctomycetota bacterium]